MSAYPFFGASHVSSDAFRGGAYGALLRGLGAASLLFSAACSGGDDDPRLLTSTVEASPEECEAGGSTVLSGLDEDGDGTLSAEEILERTVLCATVEPIAPSPEMPEGEPVSQPVARVRVDAEPPGGRCAEGGSAVSVGLDLDANGTLDWSEILDTELICDDALVSRITRTDAGDGCLAEGVAFELGRDRDQDRLLDDDEVEWTEHECGDVLARDVVIKSAEELAALAEIRVIEGALRIEDTALERAELPRLDHLGGPLVVSGNGRLEALVLPALVTLGHELDLSDNAVLATIGLGSLERIGGSVAVRDHPLLASLGLASLELIAGDLWLESNGELTELTLPLGAVGNVRVQHNPMLNRLAVSVGESSPMGDILLSGNGLLASASFSAGELGRVAVYDNAVLEALSLSVERASSITIHQCPALKKLPGKVSSSAIPLYVGDSLRIAAPITDLFSVEVGGDVTIEGSQIEWLRLRRVGGDTQVRSNPRLTRLDMGQPLGDILLQDNDALTYARVEPNVLHGDVRVEDNDALDNLSGFQNVKVIAGSLVIHGNKDLIRTHLFALTSVGESVRISDSPALKFLDLNGVATLVDLIVQGTGLEAWAGLSGLRDAAAVFIEENASLTSVVLPALISADRLHISENPMLSLLDLPALTQKAQSSTRVANNAQLPACQVENLFSRLAGETWQQGNWEEASCAP